jgi:acetyl-CoA acetyltransferase
VSLLRDKAAIIGIGHTDFRSPPQRTELGLAVEGALGACRDAGIEPWKIDGLCTVSTDEVGENDLATSLGLTNVRFFIEAPFGGGGTRAAVGLAAGAVALGLADVVLCYRALRSRSGRRLGRPQDPNSGPGGDQRYLRDLGFLIPSGISTPAQMAAFAARRHMYEYGTTWQQFAAIAINSRRYAATNPSARFFGQPLTMEEYVRGRMVADPLRVYDCCLESDAAVAVLVTRAERAGDFRQPPAYIMAFAQGMGSRAEMMSSFNRDDITVCEEVKACARELWRMAGIGPEDVDVAQVYDHFSPMVIMALEDYGFMKKGEGGPWVESGALAPGGGLPTNTSGGHIGEAYVNGMNLIAEAVRQIRGTSANQIKDVEVSFASSGSGVPTSALLLRK